MQSKNNIETDLKKCKQLAKILLYAVPLKAEESLPFLVIHPFTNSSVTISKTGKLVDIVNDESAKQEWLSMIENHINDSTNYLSIYSIINDSWKLTFFKYTKDYLCREDYADYLSDAWVRSENPNDDKNCSLKEIISWFKKADKQILMQKQDYSIYEKLPEIFTVYRGVACGRNKKGLSYTRNYKKAEWFANRFNSDKTGYVVKETICKSEVLAYFNSRNEDEIVVDTYSLHRRKTKELKNIERDR